MTLLNTLLGLNWIEQKNQGDKTRELLARANPPLPLDTVATARHLNKVQTDPKTLSHWMAEKSLLTVMRMALFGMTKAETQQAIAAHRHESGLGFPE
jgi:hypothetical protein